MKNCEGTCSVARKIAIFTLVGFLVVVLSGPLLTLAGILLPFALVGFLVWIPIKGFTVWREGGWTSVRQAAGKVARTVVAAPIWLAAHIGRSALWLLSLPFGIIGFVLRITFPTLAGALLGAMLGVVGGMEHEDLELRVPAGAMIGAGIGLIAGVTRPRHRVKIVKIVVPSPVTVQQA